MMKTPTWTVNEATGEVTKVGPFSHGLGPVEVQARTKGEATAQLLAQYARQQKAGGPRLYVRNGAYCLLTHDGNGWVSEAGTIHPSRAHSDGSMFPLCSGGSYDRPETALKHSSFDYYAGEEYQTEQRKTSGAASMVEADLIASARALDAAYDKATRHGHSIPVELVNAIMGLRGTLAKYGQTQPVESAQACGAI